MNRYTLIVLSLSALCSLHVLAHDAPPGQRPHLSSAGQIDQDVLAQRLSVLGVTRVVSKQTLGDKVLIVAEKLGQIVHFELDKRTGILKEASPPAETTGAPATR